MDNSDNFSTFRSIIGALPDTVIVTDHNGIIKIVNQKVFDIFGYTIEEIIENEIEILLPERYREIHKKHLKNYFSIPQQREMAPNRKVVGLKKDGTEFELEIMLSPLTINGEMFSISTITEKKYGKRKLLKENEELAKAKKNLEKFTYTISHDLKAPLTKIEGLITILIEDVKSGKTEEVQTISDHIKDSVSSMGSMIKNVLDDAKEEHSNYSDQTNMDELVRDIDRLINIPENFKLEIDYCSSLIPGKKNQLLQIFLNIITNSIKYNDKKEGKLHISCGESGSIYRFIFSDNGPGIPYKDQARVFNLFEKGAKDGKESSHGIGLNTVKNIVEARGGEIKLSSEIGKGTKFEFTWPKECK
jgi:PAS domain S-box-containing protein